MLTLQNDNRSMTPFVVIALESDWQSFLRIFLTFDGHSLDTRLVLQGDKVLVRSKCAQAELELEGWKEEEIELRLIVRGEVEGEAMLATDFSSGQVNLMRNGLIFMHLNLLQVEGGKTGHKVEYKTGRGSGEWSYQLNREEDLIHFESSWVKEKTKFASCNLNVSIHDEMLASASLDTRVSEGSWLQHLLGFHSLSSWTSLSLENRSSSAHNQTLISAEQLIRVDGRAQPVASISFNSSSGLEMVWRGGEGSRQELDLSWNPLHPCFGSWHCFSSFGGYLNIFKGGNRIFQFGLNSQWAVARTNLAFYIIGPEKSNLVHMEVSHGLEKSEIRVLSHIPGLEEVFELAGDESGQWKLHRGGALLASAQIQTLNNATVLMKLPHNESLELVVAAVEPGLGINLVANFTSEWESKRFSGRLRQRGVGGWSLLIEGTNPQFGDFSLARCLHLEQDQVWFCGEDQVSGGPFSLLSPFFSLLRVAWAPEIRLTAWAGQAQWAV